MSTTYVRVYYQDTTLSVAYDYITNPVSVIRSLSNSVDVARTISHPVSVDRSLTAQVAVARTISNPVHVTRTITNEVQS